MCINKYIVSTLYSQIYRTYAIHLQQLPEDATVYRSETRRTFINEALIAKEATLCTRPETFTPFFFTEND